MAWNFTRCVKLHSEKGVCSSYCSQTDCPVTTVVKLACNEVELYDIKDAKKGASWIHMTVKYLINSQLAFSS